MSTERTTGEWVEAGGVVAASASVGAALGHFYAAPEDKTTLTLLGAVTGAILGLWINWGRGCAVCREHARAMSGGA